MKKEYISADLEIVNLNTEDVIVTSGGEGQQSSGSKPVGGFRVTKGLKFFKVGNDGDIVDPFE